MCGTWIQNLPDFINDLRPEKMAGQGGSHCQRRRLLPCTNVDPPDKQDRNCRDGSGEPPRSVHPRDLHNKGRFCEIEIPIRQDPVWCALFRWWSHSQIAYKMVEVAHNWWHGVASSSTVYCYESTQSVEEGRTSCIFYLLVESYWKLGCC